MNTLESVKNIILEHIFPSLKGLKIPVYQFVPRGTAAPFGSITFAPGGWTNGLPAGYFQALVFLELDILSPYAGLQDLHESLEQVIFKLDGMKFPFEGGEFIVKHKSTDIQSQLESRQNALRRGVLRFEVRFKT